MLNCMKFSANTIHPISKSRYKSLCCCKYATFGIFLSVYFKNKYKYVFYYTLFIDKNYSFRL